MHWLTTDDVRVFARRNDSEGLCQHLADVVDSRGTEGLIDDLDELPEAECRYVCAHLATLEGPTEDDDAYLLVVQPDSPGQRAHVEALRQMVVGVDFMTPAESAGAN